MFPNCFWYLIVQRSWARAVKWPGGQVSSYSSPLAVVQLSRYGWKGWLSLSSWPANWPEIFSEMNPAGCHNWCVVFGHYMTRIKDAITCYCLQTVSDGLQIKSWGFKKRGWIIVKIWQEVVNIWIFPPFALNDMLLRKIKQPLRKV